MSKWYVKDLAKLTGISVQTLHHYDRIGLLKPSLRLPNGYRLYSEADLSKLEQIIALKFFGFELSQIKRLIVEPNAIKKHLVAQSDFLKKKASELFKAHQAVDELLAGSNTDEPISFEKIIKIIEVYHMVEDLEQSWAKSILSQDELKQYAQFQKELESKIDRAEFIKTRAHLIKLVENNLNQDPKSNIGSSVAKEWMNLINNIYGDKHANLKNIIWERGFKKGKIDGEGALDKNIIKWLDEAIDNYYRNRIYDLLSQIHDKNDKKLVSSWEDLMQEMFGNVTEYRLSTIKAAQEDKSISDIAKAWLNQFIK